MSQPVARSAPKAVDSIQQRLVDYACSLNFDSLSPDVIHAAKVRIIDTLGVLIGGFFNEPSHIARNLAVQMPNPDGATVIGTRIKTTPDMAAFVNAITARYADMIDTYHWPGSYQGHPSDVITPILATAEHAQADGRELITSVVLAYEVFCRLCDVFKNNAYDNTNFCCLGTAVAAGKLLRLAPSQLSHGISMAVVPNNMLRQVRLGRMSMWKAVASGQAGRAGVFAALLARAGMEGPHLPFEGKAGWCEHVARERFSLDTLGDGNTRFKVLDTGIKIRPANGNMISSILAAEKVTPLKNLKEVKQVTVEVYKRARESVAIGEHHWNPDSRETANQSGAYNVAAALMDGTVTLRSFDDAHLWNPELRDLLRKVEIIQNEQFTQAYERVPVEHRARVTVIMNSGERLVGEAGGDQVDLGPLSDAQIEQKFRGLTEDLIGAKRVDSVLERLWNIEDMANVAALPAAFVLG